jgi:hypothetical protein
MDEEDISKKRELTDLSSFRRMPEKSKSSSSMRGHMVSPVPPPQQHHQQQQQLHQPFDKERLLMAAGRDDSRDELNKRNSPKEREREIQ